MISRLRERAGKEYEMKAVKLDKRELPTSLCSIIVSTREVVNPLRISIQTQA